MNGDMIEFLEEGEITAVAAPSGDYDSIELVIESDATVIETPQMEYLDLIESGPSIFTDLNVWVDPAYAGLSLMFGPGPLPDPEDYPNTLYFILPPL